MRLIFMGTPDFSVTVLNSLVNAGHDIVAVYSQPPRKAGRGQGERLSPVHARALELQLPVLTPVNFKDEVVRAAFAALHADAAVVVAYGLILPNAVLAAPLQGCLNIHASLLPRWRGAAPIQRAIMAGDRETGVCIMQMDAGLDTGPVLLRETTVIAANDTYATLHDRLAEIGSRLIVQALADMTQAPIGQPEVGVTYAHKIDKAEARIDWTRSAGEIDAQIRGLSPFPGAWTLIAGQRVKVLFSETVEGSGAAGLVLDNDLTIACGSRAVRLLRLQRDGKGAMDAAEFQRGFPIAVGSRLD
jgi:methionyl-tRNA formyltransferase